MNTKDTLTKPCDDCSTNIDQAMYQDEITCYKTCKAFKEWQGKVVIYDESGFGSGAGINNAEQAYLAIEM